MAIIPNQDIWKSIAIGITLDFLYNNFKITRTSMLEKKNKLIDKIQQILTSVEAKLISKRITGITKNLAIVLKGQSRRIKRKATNKNKYFNC